MNALTGEQCFRCAGKATVGTRVDGGVRWVCASCSNTWTQRDREAAEPLALEVRDWWAN